MEPRLQPVGTSLRRWAEGLHELAAAREPAADWWERELTRPDPLVSDRALDPSRDTMATVRSHTATLAGDDVEALLTTVPAGVRGTVNDVLLTAFAMAVAEWRTRRGIESGTAVFLDLEGHGRADDLIPGADLSRTVGWFTSLGPVRLDPGAVPWRSGAERGAAVQRALKTVKEQLRALPDGGLGFGLLRYLHESTRARLARLPVPQFGFNYLGRMTSAGDTTGGEWLPAPEAEALRGLSMDPGMPAPHAVDLNVAAVDREGDVSLVATWTWPADLFDGNDIAELAGLWFQALHAVRDSTDASHGGGYTPSDLALVELDQDQIDMLETEWSDFS